MAGVFRVRLGGAGRRRARASIAWLTLCAAVLFLVNAAHSAEHNLENEPFPAADCVHCSVADEEDVLGASAAGHA